MTLIEESIVASVEVTLNELKLEESKVSTTCCNNINENGAKTMEDIKENVKENETNVKGKGEEYIPIVWNRSLSLIAGANLSYI